MCYGPPTCFWAHSRSMESAPGGSSANRSIRPTRPITQFRHHHSSLCTVGVMIDGRWILTDPTFSCCRSTVKNTSGLRQALEIVCHRQIRPLRSSRRFPDRNPVKYYRGRRPEYFRHDVCPGDRVQAVLQVSPPTMPAGVGSRSTMAFGRYAFRRTSSMVLENLTGRFRWPPTAREVSRVERGSGRRDAGARRVVIVRTPVRYFLQRLVALAWRPYGRRTKQVFTFRMHFHLLRTISQTPRPGKAGPRPIALLRRRRGQNPARQDRRRLGETPSVDPAGDAIDHGPAARQGQTLPARCEDRGRSRLRHVRATAHQLPVRTRHARPRLPVDSHGTAQEGDSRPSCRCIRPMPRASASPSGSPTP